MMMIDEFYILYVSTQRLVSAAQLGFSNILFIPLLSFFFFGKSIIHTTHSLPLSSNILFLLPSPHHLKALYAILFTADVIKEFC